MIWVILKGNIVSKVKVNNLEPSNGKIGNKLNKRIKILY